MAIASDDFLGVGLAFPLRPDPATGSFRLVAGADAVRRSIEMILGTSPGERLMRPEFGCRIHDLVFEPNTSQTRGAVESNVRDALTKFEPRIDVLNVRAETAADEPALLLIRIDYQLRLNNAVFNLVYPYFLSEGPR